MTARRNCSACSDLQENSADFVVNGVSERVELSLENNTGFNSGSGHNDCQDLNNANDCLVGNMEDEVDAHDVCEWRPFMTDFIHNLWTTLKALIASTCGQWKRIEYNECKINTLFAGKTFKIGEETTDGSYVVAGKGISFQKSGGSNPGEADVNLLYIGGALLRLTGSLNFYHSDNFTDVDYCYNFDDDGDGSNYTKNRLANSSFGQTTQYPQNGELLFEIRIKKEQYPMIKNMYSGIGGPTGGGAYQCNCVVFNAGDEAYGQTGSSPTHVVPSGWIYVQMRMVGNLGTLVEGHRYTPRGFLGIRINQDKIDCDDVNNNNGDNGGEGGGGSGGGGGGGGTTTYAVAVTASPVYAGSVSGGGTYAAGSSATVNATPLSSYSFVEWMVNGATVSTSPSYTFTVDSNVSLTAVFASNGGGGQSVNKATESIGLTWDEAETGVKSYQCLHTPAAGYTMKVSYIQNPGSTAYTWTLSAGVATSLDHINGSQGKEATFSYDGNKTLSFNRIHAWHNYQITSVEYWYA